MKSKDTAIVNWQLSGLWMLKGETNLWENDFDSLGRLNLLWFIIIVSVYLQYNTGDLLAFLVVKSSLFLFFHNEVLK